MRDEGVEVVPLEQVSQTEILHLLATSLGPPAGERNEAFWRWKHEGNPFGRSSGLVAVAGGRAVALRVFLRWRWAAGDGEIEAVRAVDTATHPDWRRRGLFRRLTLELVDRVRDEGAAFVFNTPNPRSRAGYLAMGWESVGRLPLLVRLRRPARVLGALLREPDPEPAAPAWTPAGLPPVGELLTDPGLPAFLAAWGAGEPRLHTRRTPEYLRWRYLEAPGLTYRAIWELQGTSGAVMVVRSRRRRGLRELTLPELLVSGDPGGREAARGLLERLAAAPGFDYVAACASPKSVERSVLRGGGWLPAPVGPRWVVRPLRGAAPDPRKAAAWRLSVGDLEVF